MLSMVAGSPCSTFEDVEVVGMETAGNNVCGQADFTCIKNIKHFCIQPHQKGPLARAVESDSNHYKLQHGKLVGTVGWSKIAGFDPNHTQICIGPIVRHIGDASSILGADCLVEEPIHNELM